MGQIPDARNLHPGCTNPFNQALGLNGGATDSNLQRGSWPVEYFMAFELALVQKNALTCVLSHPHAHSAGVCNVFVKSFFNIFRKISEGATN